MGLEPDQAMPAPEAVAALSRELARQTALVDEQAATIAHYKKMYDRSSALAKIGVWECDLATEALTWTDGVYDLFDLPRGSRVDRAGTVACYDEGSARDMTRLRADAIERGGSFTLDVRIRTARGTMRWLRLTADVEREDGRSVRIFGTKQDITEEKAAEEALRLLQTELIHVSRRSAMGAMAATLAHELNQPLAAISNYAAGTRRALRNLEPSNAKLATGLDEIEQCALRAGSIIRSLRGMTGAGAALRQAIKPNALIREAASLALAGGDDTIALCFDFADDVRVLVDPVQIQQVVINLISNAVEAMRDSARREILVSTCPAVGGVEIRVDDSGHGLSPAMLATAFDSFVSARSDGRGVGLAISRTIVEAHGGRIVAANRDTGGASFRILLPPADAQCDGDVIRAELLPHPMASAPIPENRV